MAFKIADLKLGQKLAALAKTKTAQVGAAIVVSAFVQHQTGTVSFSDALFQGLLGVMGITGRYAVLKQEPSPLGEDNTSRPVEGP